MRSTTGRIRRASLRLLVHVDALRLDSVAYLKAIMWRVLGRRLRSRNQLAALLGRSPHAYQLWISERERSAKAAVVPGHGCAKVSILPIVLSDGDARAVRATLASLERGGADPIVVGMEKIAGARQLRSIGELRDLVETAGTWLCFLRSGDELADDALQIYGLFAASEPEAWVFYADDDLTVAGERSAPHFKPAWNRELFESHDFIAGSSIIRVTPEMLAGLEPDQGPEKLFRSAVGKAEPRHVPAVLHHRVSRPLPRIPAKPAQPPANSLRPVSIIVPTRNQVVLLRNCIEGVRRSAYPSLELIVVDNGSDDPQTIAYLDEIAGEGVRILSDPGPFNYSRLNNAAAAMAQHDLLCFLNNDIEIIDPDWLWLLAMHAPRPDIGAVGALLLYPDGSVQHAGVVTGVGGGAGHAHRLMRGSEPGYFLRDRLPQRVSAVTAACLVVEKRKFFAVDGFDENLFPVAFNDVDLCLKLNAHGWQSFYEPRSVLIHHESKSRGKDSAKSNKERFAGELAALKRRWHTDRQPDPYHHPQLSPFCEQFYIAL